VRGSVRLSVPSHADSSTHLINGTFSEGDGIGLAPSVEAHRLSLFAEHTGADDEADVLLFDLP
jgi:hypothetical protein